VKHTNQQDYNWSFNRINSKGEILFKHVTNETVDDVAEFLNNNNIKYELTAGAGYTMFWIYFNDKKYAYFSTSGRWAQWKNGGYPTKHYTSKNIEDFYNRFLLAEPKFKIENETKESIEEILKKENIEYSITNNVVTLITKVIPRKDGRGNKRRYSYEYIIGTGKWRGIYVDNTCGSTYYQSSGIENFINKFFKPKEND
jgi:signal recognition particle GTPase